MVRIAAELLGGRSLGQVLMAFAGAEGGVCPPRGSWLSVLSQELSPACR